MITYGAIEEHRQHHARRLASQLITVIKKADAIGQWDDVAHRQARAFMREHGAELPQDFWFGAWDGRELVGMIHTGPFVGNAAWLIPRAHPRAHLPYAFNPQDLIHYLRGNMLVEEIAVAPGYQRQGIGARLLEAALEEARGRNVRNFCAAATSESSIEFFRSAGMDLQPEGEPLHPSRADGLVTTTHPARSHVQWAAITP